MPSALPRLLAPALPAAVALLLALAAAAAAQEAPAAAGEWTGTIELPGSPLGVHVELVPPAPPGEGGWTGSIDIPAQGAAGLALEEIVVEGAAVTFRIAGVPGAPTFRGTLSGDGAEIAGDFTQGGATLPFRLHRGSEAAEATGRRRSGPILGRRWPTCPRWWSVASRPSTSRASRWRWSPVTR